MANFGRQGTYTTRRGRGGGWGSPTGAQLKYLKYEEAYEAINPA